MRITSAEVIVTSPGRNFVTLKVTTDEGITGVGDATLNGRELSVAAYLQDHVAPLLIGRDARRIEDTWQYLYRGAYWRRGPVTMAAISAVDMALWDIKGKAAGMPVYQLLGGASRTGLLAYGHASGADTPMSSIRCRRTSTWGSGPSGSSRASLGWGRCTEWRRARRAALDTTTSRRAAPRCRSRRRGIPRRTCATCPGSWRRCESGSARTLPLLHDGHHRMTPIQAATLAKSLEPYHMFWLEDCTPGEHQEGLRLVRQHSTTPLAIGEVFNVVHDYQALITEQLIDYVRSAATHAGGITGLRRIIDFAGIYQIKSGFHGPTDISPVGMAAALHLGLAIHNFGIQEYMHHSEATLQVFRTSFSFTDGLLHPGEAPGLGVELDEAEAAKHPYTPAYLPVAKLRDGTVHDW